MRHMSDVITVRTEPGEGEFQCSQVGQQRPSQKKVNELRHACTGMLVLEPSGTRPSFFYQKNLNCMCNRFAEWPCAPSHVIHTPLD